MSFIILLYRVSYVTLPISEVDTGASNVASLSPHRTYYFDSHLTILKFVSSSDCLYEGVSCGNQKASRDALSKKEGQHSFSSEQSNFISQPIYHEIKIIMH